MASEPTLIDRIVGVGSKPTPEALRRPDDFRQTHAAVDAAVAQGSRPPGQGNASRAGASTPPPPDLYEKK